MPLYYFDIIEDGVMNRDEFGIDLASFEEARDQAQVLLPDIARSGSPEGDRHAFLCEVREEGRGLIYRGVLTYQGTSLANRSVSPCTKAMHDQGGVGDEATAGDAA